MAKAKTKSAAAVAAPPELSPLEKHALLIVGKKAEKVRDKLHAGEGQMVDFAVRIRGAVNVGCGESGIGEKKPNAVLLLAHVLARAGTRAQKQQVVDDSQKVEYTANNEKLPLAGVELSLSFDQMAAADQAIDTQADDRFHIVEVRQLVAGHFASCICQFLQHANP